MSPIPATSTIGPNVFPGTGITGAGHRCMQLHVTRHPVPVTVSDDDEHDVSTLS